jgi:hypothetical protein
MLLIGHEAELYTASLVFWQKVKQKWSWYFVWKSKYYFVNILQHKLFYI